MKLNELADNAGAHKKRMRVGRGEGSGKGKTGGRGVKGQTSRTGHGMANFAGGQMPLHMRMPKRGFNNPFAKQYAEVNLWRLTKAIEMGRLDAAQPMTAETLIAAGVIRRAKDGIRLLGHGEVTAKLNLTVHSASPSARKAIEDAGGVLTETHARVADEAATAQA